ncbi:polysaccharide deacetylase family protein [Herbiconiux sp.]|uniref:polysaccharide deacetylase family protein n=1 Tax=Herbiconiux sp. TaxID=1871186 RepID=UPI0025BEAF5F|nr:polysaccharide deacetylase family protein [Herbiconiux sp.]
MTPRHARARREPVVIDRRLFLGALGVVVVASASAVAAVSWAESPPAGTAAAGTPGPNPGTATPPVPSPAPTASPTPTPEPTPIQAEFTPDLQKVALPGGSLTALPGDGNLLAWTVDDGSNAEVIRLYTEFAAASGTRLTYFLNGSYSGWSENADLLRPLVQSGQIQLGNHTFDHADLTKLSDAGVIDQLQRNHDFILRTYGVDARPYFRPPFGYHDARVDRLAASIGYTCPVLWYGTLSDSGLITEQQVVEFATTWFLPQHIVIGHLNFAPVTNVFPQLQALIAERGLRTVTLDDVFQR